MIRWPTFERNRSYVIGATFAAAYLATWTFIAWLPLRCVGGG